MSLPAVVHTVPAFLQENDMLLLLSETPKIQCLPKKHTHQFCGACVFHFSELGYLHLGQMFHCLLYRVSRVFEIFQLSAEIRFVRTHIEIAVTRKIE